MLLNNSYPYQCWEVPRLPIILTNLSFQTKQPLRHRISEIGSRGFWEIRHLKGLSASWRVWTVDIELAWTIIRWVDISEPMTIVVCFVDFISRHHIVSPKHGVEYLMRSEEIDFDLNPLQLPCSVGKLSYSIPQTNAFLETHLFR